MQTRAPAVSLGAAVLLLLVARALWLGLVHLEALAGWAVWGGTREGAWARVTTNPLGPSVAQLAALSAVSLGLSRTLGIKPWRGALRRLGSRPLRSTVLAVALGASLQLPLVELGTLLCRVWPALALDDATQTSIAAMTRIDSFWTGVGVVTAVVAIAPITEETLFRGLLLANFETELGRAQAVLASAALFGLFHLVPLLVVIATLAGLALGLLYTRTRSLLLCACAHAGFNAVPLVLSRDRIEIAGFNSQPSADIPWIWLLASALIAVTTVFVLRFPDGCSIDDS
jgi:membrane protease YdiL (CAAX protease family)